MKTNELILVVDDTPANLAVISDLLTAAGFEVAIATSGERALKQVQHRLPDLILLDVMMPGIDGFETCQRLKSGLNTHDVPIIFMTAISDAESKVKGLNLGAVDYITKPFQHKEVLARIDTQLKLRNLTRNLEAQVAERTAALTQALQDLQSSQVQLLQSEKMSALGQLVAGIAHEINNPVGFIAGNLSCVERYFQDLTQHLQLYQAKLPQPGAEILENAEAIDLEYLLSDLPNLITSMQTGTERIRHLCHSLKVFSRADTDRPALFNIHDGIDSTLLLLKHRLKGNNDRPSIEVLKNYGNLPEIECYPGQLNQVLMNILVNAIDALEESNLKWDSNQTEVKSSYIKIQTSVVANQQISIRIEDNGIGMSDDVKQKAFDYLFTTKPIGQGTGLGLAISHEIIVKKHQGTLEINSVPGQGTEFIINLPIKINKPANLDRCKLPC